jgi:hypothetical protein
MSIEKTEHMLSSLRKPNRFRNIFNLLQAAIHNAASQPVYNNFKANLQNRDFPNCEYSEIFISNHHVYSVLALYRKCKAMPLSIYKTKQANTFSILMVEGSSLPDIEPITLTASGLSKEEDTIQLLESALEKMRDEKKGIFLCAVPYNTVKDTTDYLLLFYKSDQYKYDYHVTPIQCTEVDTHESFEEKLSHSMFSHEVTEGHKIIGVFKGPQPRQLLLVQARSFI